MWALKVVESDIPFASCDNIGKLFKLMFQSERRISRDFTCGEKKISYLITHGLAPYFKDCLLEDVKKSNAGFTLHYDESTTAQVKKQMDIVLRYWSVQKKGVIVHYLGSSYFGRADAATGAKELLESLSRNGLPLNKLLALSSDGPNVNKAVSNQVNKELNESMLPSLMDIGTCNLH